MSEINQDDVVAALGNMNVMQIIALTKHLEEKWGVEAKPQMVEQATNSVQETKPAEQTEFTVVFTSFPPDKKMTLVKLIREVMGIGLLESKNLVESLPKVLKEGATKEEADLLKSRMTEAGGIIEIK